MEEPIISPAGKAVVVSELPDAVWDIALRRFNIIAPIINNVPGASIVQLAKNARIGRATFYRWLEKYRQTGTISSLVDEENHGGKGKSRLPENQDTIIAATIDERFLDKQKLTIRKVSIDVALYCRDAGLKVPHYNTVRNRINQLSEEQKMAKRYSANAARNKYDEIEACFPGADHPLAAVQIDQTKLDIMVVDEVYRESVGRPWITLAIDVFSRMVVGFYISLDPPGALGTGLCLSHSILAKELWLDRLGVPGKWPCHGIMRSLYLDNAVEFRGKMLERACLEYGVEINFRPVTKPYYGGHIERLMGTVLGEIHALPGTTFSNIKDRKDYDCEAKACFTLKELEKWVAEYIIGVYHQSLHTGINTTPLARWNEGVHGNSEQIGTGLGKPIADELKLKLDFMPFEERTVQPYGVQIDSIWYYGDVLRKWVYAFEKPNARYKSKKKFVFKRDPRDISAVYFYDPQLKDYYPIPYRNMKYPPLTIWELKRILRDLKARGMKEVDEETIFATYARLKVIEKNASGTTAATRRRTNNARKELAVQNSIKNQVIPEQTKEPEPVFRFDPNVKYLPFEELIHDPFNRNKTSY